MHNALTIDVEDYYQVSAFESVVQYNHWERYESRVEQNTYRILDLLDAHCTQATFFVLGWIAERRPTLVRAIHTRGHEVASHGYAHRRIYTQTPSEFLQETQRSKYLLEDIIGHPVLGYRAASYSITAQSLWALDILQEQGFIYDSSIFPIRHDLYGMANAPRFCHVRRGRNQKNLFEIPPSTIQLGGMNMPIAGGGYFRLFPYALTQLAIRHLNKREKQPAIVYFHPWEIDPEQPRIRASWRSRLRHYTALSRMESKLQHLLSDFSFAPMREVFSTYLNDCVA